MFAKNVYRAGVYLRNKAIFEKLEFLKDSESWNIEQLQSYQLKKCKELLVHAYEKSAYYKARFDELGITPEEFNKLEDLKKFPIIEKNDIKKNTQDIQIKNGFKKLFYSETSGSTGQPLVFYRDEQWDAGHRAAIFRGYSWHGINPWDRNGYFWGYNIDLKDKLKTNILDLLQNRFRIFSYNEDEIEVFIKKLKRADYVEGYSSMIYQTAKIINESNKIKKNNIKLKKLKMVKGTSEKIFDIYRDEVEKAFGLPIISEYGAAEAGIIAFECPHGNMHITMENVIVEEVEGQILVTNLISKSFPIIRYKLGDYIELDLEKSCTCGMSHPIIKSVLGRVGKSIYGKKSMYPSLTLYYIFKNLAELNIVINYQVIQREKGKLDIYIENKLNNNEYLKLIKELDKYFSDDIEINIHDENPINRGQGKMKDFISYVN